MVFVSEILLIMSIKLNIDNSVKEVTAQYLPCKIDHDGDINIKQYFDPYTEETNKDDKTGKVFDWVSFFKSSS